MKENQMFIMRVLAAKQDYMKFLNQFSVIADSAVERNREDQ